jgi:transposase InsO family protein
MAKTLSQTYPVRTVCGVLGVAPSSHYYLPAGGDDAALREAIQEVAGRWPTYGYRRITAELARAGWSVNHKRVARLMVELGLSGKAKRVRRRTTDSHHGEPRFTNLVRDLEVIRPEQVWVGDITYIHLARGCVYLAVVMDVFTRAIRGWELSRALDYSLSLTALQRALHTGKPAIHHSDQGVQYAAQAYRDELTAAKVAISMADVGAAWQNGYAERLMRTIKEEEVYLSQYEDYADALAQLGRFLDGVYMHKRIHSALGYLTPVEFEAQWLAQQGSPVLAAVLT